MKNRLIRKGVFETNSSSSHSVTICSKDNEEEGIIEGLDRYIKDGIVWLDCYGAIYNNYHKDAFSKITFLASLWNNNPAAVFDLYDIYTLEDFVKKNTGCEKVYFYNMEKRDDINFDGESSFLPYNKDELYDLIFETSHYIRLTEDWS